MKKHKLSANDFKYFCEMTVQSLGILGVTDYEITIIQKDLGENLGETSIDMESGQGVIRVNNLWDTKPTREDIKGVAIHEACEALLWGLMCQGLVAVSEAYVNAERHRVISRLVPMLRRLV